MNENTNNKSINVTNDNHYELNGIRHELRLRTFNEVIKLLIDKFKESK